jgi:leucyl aminopeptidase
LIEGIAMCRDMVNAPANFLTPTTYADKIAALDTPALGIPGLDIEVLGEQQLKALGMGALLAVGRGSENESQVAILKWKGNPDNDKTDLALVGKGVTFDSGGLSLKPGKGMEDMKTDMGGSAVVVGTLITLARRKAKANVVGIVGLVENMPSHNAYRPSDVITSYSGKTIEVLNTDAEGRLVLADCLSYIEERYQPNSIIDIATLTGAIVMALGQEFGGLFSNSDSLANSLLHAADRSGEPLWQMPLSDAYDKQLDSKVADMINLSLKPGAGSSIAAHFLQRFVSNANWAHLDIAGMVWKDQPNHSQPFGASGYGVRLLDTLVSNDIEAR